MLELQTLGLVGLRSREIGDSIAVPVQPKRLALLAYLALAGRRRLRRRSLIIGLFWPELDDHHARGALRQALSSIRRTLGDDVLISQGEEEIGINGAELWCDALALTEADESDDLEAVLATYHGDFLAGLAITDAAAELEEWVAGERANLRRAAARIAWILAERAEQQQEWVAAFRFGRRAAALSPDDEMAVGRLIGLLNRGGDRVGAIATYEELRRWLAAEFAVAPSPTIEALIAEVRGGGGVAGTGP